MWEPRQSPSTVDLLEETSSLIEDFCDSVAYSVDAMLLIVITLREQLKKTISVQRIRNRIVRKFETNIWMEICNETIDGNEYEIFDANEYKIFEANE